MPKKSIFDLTADQPWLILRESLDQIIAIANRDVDVDAVASKIGRPLSNSRTVTMRGNTAIIPVHGPIFRYANLFTMISGATSIDILSQDLQTAIDDPSVQSIILDIDSPGGMVAGVSEFSRQVRASSKPVTAYVSNAGASAAYWIASAASKIIVADTASVGSIGVVATISTDKESGKVEIVSDQSPNKRADVTTDEGKAHVQIHVNTLADVFVEAVAKYRGVEVEKVLSDFGKGGMLVGAHAVAAGMADEVGSLELIIAGLSGNQPKSEIMADEDKTKDNPSVPVTREFIEANHPDIAAEFKAEGAALELDRIKAVESASLPGHEDLIESLKNDGRTTGDQAAMAVLKAEKSARKDNLDSIRRRERPVDLPENNPKTKSKSKDKDFKALVEEKVASGMPKSDAICYVVGNSPDEYAAMLRENQ